MNMSAEFIMGLAGQAVFTVLKVSAPMLVVALVVGLLISIFQATTQIQEQTLAFVPKIVAVMIVVLLFGPWILTTLVDFTHNILNNLHHYIG
jgi:flagellar biosynthesis protein FliQ